MATLPGQGNVDVTKAFAYRWRRFSGGNTNYNLVLDSISSSAAIFRDLQSVTNICRNVSSGGGSFRNANVDPLSNVLFINNTGSNATVTLSPGPYFTWDAFPGSTNCSIVSAPRNNVRISLFDGAFNQRCDITGGDISGDTVLSSTSARVVSAIGTAVPIGGMQSIAVNAPVSSFYPTLAQSAGTCDLYRGGGSFVVPNVREVYIFT